MIDQDVFVLPHTEFSTKIVLVRTWNFNLFCIAQSRPESNANKFLFHADFILLYA